jgi:hypothetical protein
MYILTDRMAFQIKISFFYNFPTSEVYPFFIGTHQTDKLKEISFVN